MIQTIESYDEKRICGELLDTDDITLQKPVSAYSSDYKFISEINLNSSKKLCNCPPVLIVDDCAFNLLVLSKLLDTLMVKCDQANNGDRGVSKALQASKCSNCKGYSLIFMDCEMPVKDGYQASRELNEMMSSKQPKYVKIVALTGHIGEDEMRKCIDHGMSEFSN